MTDRPFVRWAGIAALPVALVGGAWVGAHLMPSSHEPRVADFSHAKPLPLISVDAPLHVVPAAFPRGGQAARPIMRSPAIVAVRPKHDDVPTEASSAAPITPEQQSAEREAEAALEQMQVGAPDSPLDTPSKIPELTPQPISADPMGAEPIPPQPIAGGPKPVPEPDQLAEPQGVLPLSQDLNVRSPQMNIVGRQADQHLARGAQLAQRGALYSARDEFFAALHNIADALDAQSNTTVHGEALAAGLRALMEVDDFVARQGNEVRPKVKDIAANHRTPVLHDQADLDIPPVVAEQRYFTYAQEQLGAALGNEPAGSRALYALGKLYSVMMTQPGCKIVSCEAKSMVFHQAALLVDRRNYLSANELGVLLARFAQYDQARAMLELSISCSPSTAAWHNLAVVQARLGNGGLSAQARAQEMQFAQRKRWQVPGGAVVTENSAVVWTDPQQFSSLARPATDARKSTATAMGPGAKEAEPQAKRLLDRVKW